MRITNVDRALDENSLRPEKFSISVGQYTVAGAGSCTPSSCTSADDADDLTPGTRGGVANALAERGAPVRAHISRARFSEITATGLRSSMIGPRDVAARNERRADRLEESGRRRT